MQCVKVNELEIANDRPLTVIGGLNVLEDLALAKQTCECFMEACAKLKMPYIFKASFDKANRSSLYSYRGPGLDKGMEIFDAIKKEYNVNIITDVHEPYQCDLVAPHVDVLQLPAFLRRLAHLFQLDQRHKLRNDLAFIYIVRKRIRLLKQSVCIRSV